LQRTLDSKNVSLRPPRTVDSTPWT